MSDSTTGTLETFMGDYEKLKAPLAATRIGSALQIAILQHRDALKSASNEESDRYEEFLNLDEELHPKRKPTKKKEEEVGSDDEEDDEDENAYKYCYWGKGKVKDESTGKMIEIEGEIPKKRFVTIATPVKLVLQYMLNCFVNECRIYYLENDNSFPGDNLMNAIQTFVFENRDNPITPFIYKVSKLYKNVDEILEDDNTKGTGKLGEFIENTLKDIFDLKKTGKNTSSKLYIIRETYVSFIKVLAIYIMDYLWEQRSPFNLGMLLGAFRQLSRMVGGGECPDIFYDYCKMFVKENETKKAANSKASGAKGKGKGRGRPPSSTKSNSSSASSTTSGEPDKTEDESDMDDKKDTKVSGKANPKAGGKGGAKASAKANPKGGAKANPKGDAKASGKANPKTTAKAAGKTKGRGKSKDDEDDDAIASALDAEAGSDEEGEKFNFDEFEDTPLPDDE